MLDAQEYCTDTDVNIDTNQPPSMVQQPPFSIHAMLLHLYYTICSADRRRQINWYLLCHIGRSSEPDGTPNYTHNVSVLVSDCRPK